MNPPKLFFSYSWTTPEYEQVVINLATALRDNGIDVILDKLHLGPGQDAFVFMEQMVTDENITKVAMLCDQTYAEKADARKGGVGTETQLISREVYESHDQNKFVAVVMEKDEAGRACVPTYYKSRIHIDLSEPSKYSNEFEKLVRWVFDKPLHVPPNIGKAPAFITDPDLPQLGTTSRANLAMRAIKEQKGNYLGILQEYLETLSDSLETLRLSCGNQENFVESVLQSIENFLPYRNEYIQLVSTIARYANNSDTGTALHRFFEKLAPYLQQPERISRYTDWDLDNFKFIIHELFLYTVAIFLKEERFNMAHILLETEYYVARHADFGRNVMVGYDEFCQPADSIYNLRKKENRLCKHADLLHQRSSSSGVDFKYLLQADFLCWIRKEIKEFRENVDHWHTWYPIALLYIERFGHAPFEIFARASSKKYFEQIKSLIDIESPKDLEGLLIAYQQGNRRVPKWQFQSFNPETLLGYNTLASKP